MNRSANEKPRPPPGDIFFHNHYLIQIKPLVKWRGVSYCTRTTYATGEMFSRSICKKILVLNKKPPIILLNGTLID